MSGVERIRDIPQMDLLNREYHFQTQHTKSSVKVKVV